MFFPVFFFFLGLCGSCLVFLLYCPSSVLSYLPFSFSMPFYSMQWDNGDIYVILGRKITSLISGTEPQRIINHMYDSHV